MTEVTEQAWSSLNRATQAGDFQLEFILWSFEHKLSCASKIAVFQRLKCSLKSCFHLCEELGNFECVFFCLSMSPVPSCSSHWYFTLLWRTEKGIFLAELLAKAWQNTSTFKNLYYYYKPRKKNLVKIVTSTFIVSLFVIALLSFRPSANSEWPKKFYI